MNAHAPHRSAEAPPQGLLVDWGGVLTPPLEPAFAAWAAREGVDPRHLGEALGPWFADPGDRSPVHRLERGEMPETEFEQVLARRLADLGSPCPAPGLLARMLADLAHLDPTMLALVADARAAGVRTVMLSNSWGDHYPDVLRDGRFEALVISGEVGLRKPDPRVYRHAAAQVGLRPDDCVMVDDVQHNLDAAAALGMRTVLHRTVTSTVAEVRALFPHALG